MRPSSTSILLGEYHDIPKSMHPKSELRSRHNIENTRPAIITLFI